MNPTTPTYRFNISKTFRARLYASYGEGQSASVYMGEHLITLTSGPTGQLSAVIDGQNTPVSEADRLLTWARAEGVLEVVSEEQLPVSVTPAAAPIGNELASQLHKELGRLQFGRGYDLASEVLQRRVTSLAALTMAEHDLVREYAYGQWGVRVGERAA